MFEFLTIRRMREWAVQDAQVGVDLESERIQGVLGSRPSFAPATNDHDQQMLQESRPDYVEEFRDDYRRAEQELIKHTSPRGLTVALVATGIGGWIGSIGVLAAAGVENPDRIILGALLDAAILFAVYTAWKLAGKGSKWVYFAVGAIGVLALAITTLRVESVAGEDSSRAADLALGVVMLAVTLGAALMAERLMKLRAPGVAALKERAIARRGVRGAQRSSRLARMYITARGRDGLRWDADAARLGAVYRSNWRATRARVAARSTATPSA